MKTFRITSVVAILMVVLQLANAAVSVPLVNTQNENNSNQGFLVKAIFTNGEYLPVVDLPEVEIIAARYNYQYVKGKIVDGQVVAVVDLPSIEISVSSLSQSTNTYATHFEPIYDIPVIEITDYLPNTSIVSGIISENISMPVVDLPEITIYTDNIGQQEWLAFLNDTDNNTNLLAVSNPSNNLVIKQLSLTNEQFNNVIIDIHNCVAVNTKTIVCEFVSESGVYTTQKIKNGFLKVVFNK